MLTIPSFLLRRLYVAGSLRNTPQGAQFQLENKLGTGYARRLLPLVLDGQELPMKSCSFSGDGGQLSFDAVSNETPLTLNLNKTITVTINDVVLSPEPHKMIMGFEVLGLGVLQFDFVDVPADGR